MASRDPRPWTLVRYLTAFGITLLSSSSSSAVRSPVLSTDFLYLAATCRTSCSNAHAREIAQQGVQLLCSSHAIWLIQAMWQRNQQRALMRLPRALRYSQPCTQHWSSALSKGAIESTTETNMLAWI